MKHPEIAIADMTSTYLGLGRRKETEGYMSIASVYDPSNGSSMFRVSGLRYHKHATQEDPYAARNYSRVTWKPDITLMPQEALREMVQKNPNVKLMEVNIMRDDSKSA